MFRTMFFFCKLRSLDGKNYNISNYSFSMNYGEALKESTKLMSVAFIGAILGVIIATFVNLSNRSLIDYLLVFFFWGASIFSLGLILWFFERYIKSDKK